MNQESKKLERLLDALTEDIFNDVECAKAVINEAGFDSTISSTEGVQRIAQLQEDTFRKSNSLFIYDVGSYNVDSLVSFECTIFRLDESLIKRFGEIPVNEISFPSKKTKGRCNSSSKKISSSRQLDEEKLQLN